MGSAGFAALGSAGFAALGSVGSAAVGSGSAASGCAGSAWEEECAMGSGIAIAAATGLLGLLGVLPQGTSRSNSDVLIQTRRKRERGRERQRARMEHAITLEASAFKDSSASSSDIGIM